MSVVFFLVYGVCLNVVLWHLFVRHLYEKRKASFDTRSQLWHDDKDTVFNNMWQGLYETMRDGVARAVAGQRGDSSSSNDSSSSGNENGSNDGDLHKQKSAKRCCCCGRCAVVAVHPYFYRLAYFLLLLAQAIILGLPSTAIDPLVQVQTLLAMELVLLTAFALSMCPFASVVMNVVQPTLHIINIYIFAVVAFSFDEAGCQVNDERRNALVESGGGRRRGRRQVAEAIVGVGVLLALRRLCVCLCLCLLRLVRPICLGSCWDFVGE